MSTQFFQVFHFFVLGSLFVLFPQEFARHCLLNLFAFSFEQNLGFE